MVLRYAPLIFTTCTVIHLLYFDASSKYSLQVRTARYIRYLNDIFYFMNKTCTHNNPHILGNKNKTALAGKVTPLHIHTDTQKVTVIDVHKIRHAVLNIYFQVES